MTTTNTDIITQLLEAIDNSKLSEERKQHWFNTIAEGRFGEKEAAELTAEFDAEIVRMKNRISHLKTQLVHDRQKLKVSERNLMVPLKQLAAKLPVYLEQHKKNYESKILKAEDELMKGLEGLAQNENHDEMSALYAKLGVKKR